MLNKCNLNIFPFKFMPMAGAPSLGFVRVVHVVVVALAWRWPDDGIRIVCSWAAYLPLVAKDC